jgi:hypothetical protein
LADKTRTRSSPFLLLCTICFVSTWNKCPWELKRHRTRRSPYPLRGAGGGLFSLSNTCRPWLNLIWDDKQLHTTSKRRERLRCLRVPLRVFPCCCVMRIDEGEKEIMSRHVSTLYWPLRLRLLGRQCATRRSNIRVTNRTEARHMNTLAHLHNWPCELRVSRHDRQQMMERCWRPGTDTRRDERKGQRQRAAVSMNFPFALSTGFRRLITQKWTWFRPCTAAIKQTCPPLDSVFT